MKGASAGGGRGRDQLGLGVHVVLPSVCELNVSEPEVYTQIHARKDRVLKVLVMTRDDGSDGKETQFG